MTVHGRWNCTPTSSRNHERSTAIMSGFCGYDLTLVDGLRAAMVRAVDELDALRCSDVEAVATMRLVATARSTLRDTWLPFTTSLLSCRAMDGYQPAVIDRGDLINSWIRLTSAERGWRTATDASGTGALSAGSALTVEQVRAIGDALSGAAGDEPLTDAEINWLARALEHIAARPALVAALLPAMTTIGWTNLCDQLGAAKQRMATAAVIDGGRDATADEQADRARIDGMFARLGAIVVADRAVHPRSDATLLLTDMTPYAAAALAVTLDLDADAVAATTRRVVERERELIDHPVELVLGPRAADLLFATMLSTPGAPKAYVLLTLDAPQLAMEATDDPALAHLLVRTGTDPANMTPAQAAIAMPAIVRWLLDARTRSSSLGYDPELTVTLADLAAPHLLQLVTSGTNSYALSDRERRAIQTAIISDGAALDHLLSERDRVLGHLAAGLPADPIERIAALGDLAALLAVVDSMRKAARIRTAEQDQAEWDLAWDLLDKAVGLIPAEGLWSVVPGAAVTLLRTGLEAAGVGPESVGEVRAAALGSFDTMTTIAAATVVCARFDQLVATGQIAPGTPLPPVPDVEADDVGEDYGDRFETWLVESGIAGDVVVDLHDVKQTIASDHEAARNANDALLGG